MKKILCLVFAMFMISACTQTEPVTNDVNSETPTDNYRQIQKSNEPIDYDQFELLGEYTTNFEGIEDACVSLYTSAQRNKKGELMWDDSNIWFLEVKVDDGVYMLYNGRMNGQAYMQVITSYHDDMEENVVNLNLHSNAGTSILEYRFRDNAFEEGLTYSTDEISNQGISELYSSIPQYE